MTTSPSGTRLRVLHVSQPTSEGTASVVRHLAAVGVGDGQSVTVACPRVGPLHDWVESEGASWRELALHRELRASDVLAILRLRRLFADFDLVHLHSSKAGALGRIAAATSFSCPPIIFVPHGWSWLVGGRLADTYKLLERFLSKRSRAIVAVSEEERALGVDVLGNGSPLVVIENGVDVEAFRPTGERAARSEDTPLIVCVGRLSRQKGQDLLIRALAELADATVRLRLVGSGPDQPLLEELVKTLGLEDRVEFLGHAIPQDHLRAADVVVLPSRWEGLALALLEAMASGCAIIASDRGSSRALGDAGIVLPIDDERAFVAQLADALEELLTDDGLRQALGDRARAKAVQRYSMQRGTEEWRGLWKQICG